MQKVWGSLLRSALPGQLPPATGLSDKHVEDGLQSLCYPPLDANKFKEISNLLKLLDGRMGRTSLDNAWHLRPRTYTVLRSIGCLAQMDNFIQNGFTDFHLPYRMETFPEVFANKHERLAFLAEQTHVLTQIRELERPGAQHLQISGSADIHFGKIRFLGQGGNGSVDLVWSRLSLKQYARKCVRRGHDSLENRRRQQYLIQEVNILKTCSQRHLVQIVSSYTDEHHIGYLMEPYADADLSNWLQMLSGKAHEAQVPYHPTLRQFYGCLSGAVDYLHARKIRHRDIKSCNILIKDYRVFISDFGSAYDWGLTNRHTTQDRIPVSHDYMAPEIAKNKQRNSASDMWSLGVVFLEISTVLLGRTLAELKGHVEKRAIQRRNNQPYIWANLTATVEWMRILQDHKTSIDNGTLAWIGSLLQARPENRLTASTLMQRILDSPYFETYCCLDCVPDFQQKPLSDMIPPVTTDGLSETNHDINIFDQVAELFAQDDSEDMSGVALDMSHNQTVDSWLSEAWDYWGPDQEQWSSPSDLMESPPPTFSQSRLVELNAASLPVHPSLSTINELPLEASPIGFSEWQIEDDSDSDSGSDDVHSGDGSPERLFEIIDDSSDESDTDTIVPFRKEECLEETTPAGCDEVSAHRSNLAEALDHLDLLENEDGDGPTENICLPNPSMGIDPVDVAVSDTQSLPHVQHTATSSTSSVDAVNPPDHQTEIEKRFVLVSEPLLFPHRDVVSEPYCTIRPIESNTVGPGSAPKSFDTCSRTTEHTANNTRPGQIRNPEDITQTPRTLISPPISPNINASRPRSPVVPPKIPLHTERDPYPIPVVVVSSVKAESTPQSSRTTQTSSKGIKGPQLLSTKNIKTLNSSGEKAADASLEVPKPNLNQRKAGVEVTSSGSKIGISPSVYMDTAWESASVAPTSVMSEGTRKSLAFFPSRWLDRDHKLLENYCAQGKAAAVRYLLERGCHPGTKQKPRPAMRVAIRGASQRHNKCVAALIDKQGDVNMCSKKDGSTPLHWAVENPPFSGYSQLIRMLVENGADPNKADFGGTYPLQKLFAAAGGSGPFEKHHKDTLACILKCSGLINLDITVPGSGDTLLHLAVGRRDPMATGMLLFKGATVDTRNSAGATPLMVAAGQWRGELTEDQKSILRFLLEKNLSIDDKASVTGRTPLHQAISAGSVYATQLLLEHGADPAIKTNDGQNALGLASAQASQVTSETHAEMMSLLSSKIGLGTPEDEDSCMLETALFCISLVPLKELLENGMSASIALKGKPLLHYAIAMGKIPLARLLLKHGADPDGKNAEGEHAAAYAEKQGEMKIKDLLDAQRAASKV